MTSEQTSIGRSDTDIIVRMLNYCDGVLRLEHQVMSYCEIDAAQLERFTKHCMNRGLLRLELNEDGLTAYITTERGSEVLRSFKEILEALGEKYPE